eukprot:3378715-Rhodomonas_salina.1
MDCGGQGAVNMLRLLSIFMFDDSFLRIISITFASLILTELLMVVLGIQRWSCVMVLAQLLSLASYLVSFFLLPTYFDVGFIFTRSPSSGSKSSSSRSLAASPLASASGSSAAVRPEHTSRLRAGETDTMLASGGASEGEYEAIQCGRAGTERVRRRTMDSDNSGCGCGSGSGEGQG